jgi:hypothetical protein
MLDPDAEDWRKTCAMLGAMPPEEPTGDNRR